MELIRDDGVVEKVTRDTREEALAYAESLAPRWIEVGDISALGTPDQRHTWTTLRRRPDGTYAKSPLRWESRGRRT